MISQEQRDYNRAAQRRSKLRRRLRMYGKVERLQVGWAVAPSRIAHLMVEGVPACGNIWIDDGTPPPAPTVECRRCLVVSVMPPIRGTARGEDWSEFEGMSAVASAVGEPESGGDDRIRTGE